MRYFFSKACLLLALLCTHAVAVDFKTYYLERSDNPDPEFSLLLHLYQTQLNASLSTSHYHRFLLHALLGIPPRPLPAMLELPSSITLLPDDWSRRERISLPDLQHAVVALALQQEHEPLPEHLDRQALQQLLSIHLRWRGQRATLQEHLVSLQDNTAAVEYDERAAHTLTHLLVRAVLQVLWNEGLRLQQLQALVQRMPTARQLGVAEQRQASALLRVLVLTVDELQELPLSNAERGLLEQLVRDQQRQRRVRQALIGGGVLTAAVLLGRGGWMLRGIDVRALWSKRVLGMQLGYSVTTLAALYPAWQLGKAVKWQVQRALQTPADLRQHSDYRIAYLAFLSNPRNLQHQQQLLHTLNRCLQKLQPLFAEQEINVKVNAQRNRYRIVREANHLNIAVPYSASSDVRLALEQVILQYYEGQLPPNVLPAEVRYCRRDRV